MLHVITDRVHVDMRTLSLTMAGNPGNSQFAILPLVAIITIHLHCNQPHSVSQTFVWGPCCAYVHQSRAEFLVWHTNCAFAVMHVGMKAALFAFSTV